MEFSKKAKSFMKLKENDNIALYSLKALIQRYSEDSLSQVGGQLAYFFILSLFPFLMLINQVISMLDMDFIFFLEEYGAFIPDNMTKVIHSYILQLTADKSPGIFTFGAISTILLASKAIQSLMSALNRAFRVNAPPGIIKVVISFVFTALLIILIPISILFASVGKNLFKKAMDFLGLGESLVSIWPYMRFLVPLAGLILAVTALYNIIPKKGFPKKYTLIGAVFSSALWIIMALGLSYYTSNFGNYSVVYGSLGAIMIVLLFLYWSGIIVVLGGELAHILAMRKKRDFSHDIKERAPILYFKKNQDI